MVKRIRIPFSVYQQPFVTFHGSAVIISECAAAHRSRRPFVKRNGERIESRLRLPICLAHDRDSVGNSDDIDNSGKACDRRSVKGRKISTEHWALFHCGVHQSRQSEIDTEDRAAINLAWILDTSKRFPKQGPILFVLERWIRWRRNLCSSLDKIAKTRAASRILVNNSPLFSPA